MQLGKLSPRHDDRTLLFETYAGTLPTPPASRSWSGTVPSWPMMGNDTIGDCTCAAAGHMIECWTANSSVEVTPGTSEIIKAYSAVSGYDPSTGQNDNGAAELDVLNYWRKTGIATRKISAYASVKPKNHDHVRQAVNLFGGCYVGISLPLSAQGKQSWTVTTGPNAKPGSWGGHAVPIVAYDNKTLTVVTWGMLLTMSWQFWDKYCDEAYAVLSPDWIEADQLAPSGFNVTALLSDLKQVAA